MVTFLWLIERVYVFSTQPVQIIIGFSISMENVILIVTKMYGRNIALTENALTTVL